MDRKALTSAVYLQSLLLIQLAMLLGIVLFAVVAVYSRVSAGAASLPLSSVWPLVYIVAGVSIACLPMSVIITRRLTAQAIEKPTFAGKLRAYQIACMVRAALAEVPALFATAVLLVTGVYGFLIVPAIAVAMLAYTLPTKDNVIDSLHLDADDARRLRDPAHVLGASVPADKS